jgi:hypothetical protein
MFSLEYRLVWLVGCLSEDSVRVLTPARIARLRGFVSRISGVLDRLEEVLQRKTT